jgi:hypothetical protein
MGRAKMGELRRAARRLGVTSTMLRQHGWKTASAERIEAVRANPPGWLTEARERLRQKKARQRQLRDRRETATRLGVQARAVGEHDIEPGEVASLLAAPPDWLVAAQARQRAQAERQAKDALLRDLTEELVLSVHETWFQELKRARSDEERDAVDAQWAPEVGRAKREARQLVDELTPGQVRAPIRREQAAAHDAAVYRATEVLRRASGGQHG